MHFQATIPIADLLKLTQTKQLAHNPALSRTRRLKPMYSLRANVGAGFSRRGRVAAASRYYAKFRLMRVVRSAADAGAPEPSVVSIGNFDGVHLGHRAILETVVRRAAELNCRSVAMTFSPHPIRFLAPYKAPKLITTLRQKI